MPHFHCPPLATLAHDAELILAGNAAFLVTFMDNRRDCALFARILLN